MKVKYIKPSVAFFLSVLFFNLFPGLYIYLLKEYEMLYKVISQKEYEQATILYLWSVALVLLLFSFSLFTFKFVFFRVNYLKKEEIHEYNSAFNTLKCLQKTTFYNYTLSRKKFVFNMGMLGVLFVCIYFITGGYEKIFSYGSGMDSWEFRIIGYGDRFAGLTAILEISRKIFLPFACLYFMNLSTIENKKTGFRDYCFLFFLLLAGVMTFDRAPILLFFVLLVFKKYSLGASLGKTIILPFLLLVGVVIIAGITTFVQYNITEFSFLSIFETGIRFFMHRTVVVPSVASIELAYFNFPLGSEKLNLEFSRLGALVGRDYISIRTEDVSDFVSPVGFIADIWRNFGIFGLSIVSIFLGIYFALLDYLIEKLDPVSKIAASFTTISLCFYFIFGVFFSQGVFAQIFFLVFVAIYLQKDGLRKQVSLSIR